MSPEREARSANGGPFAYERAEQLLEYHLARTSRGAHTVFLTVALLLVAVCAALPVISVDVYVDAPGIIRPTSEKHEVTVGVDGFVEAVHVSEAHSVEAGDVLLAIRATPTDVHIESLTEDLRRAEASMADLRTLLDVSGNWDEIAENLSTVEYAQEARELGAQVAEVDLRVANEGRELHLLELQLEKRVVTPAEVASQRFEFEHTTAQRALLLEGTRRRWAQDLARLGEEARTLRFQGEQLAQTRALYEVRSPVGGSVDEVLPLSPGSFVRAGTRVAVISPDVGLVGDVLVPPHDVGLVKMGGPVVLRVDAFNPHEWGVLTGAVTSISGDILEGPSGPIFRVRTSLDRGFLELPSGHRGNVRKGMTFDARFLVARRTLFQLLRDKVDDWVIDPGRPGAAS